MNNLKQNKVKIKNLRPLGRSYSSNKSTPEEKLKEWGINKEFLLCPTCYKKKMKHVKQ